MGHGIYHRYFAAFRTKENELRGYAYADDDVKAQMLPVVTLTRHRESESLAPSLQKLLQVTNGNSVIVDFDPSPTKVTSDEEYDARAEKANKNKEEKGISIKQKSERQITAIANKRKKSQAAAEAYNAYIRGLASPMEGYSNWRSFLADMPGVIPVAQLSNPAGSRALVTSITAHGGMVAFRVDVRSEAAITALIASASGLQHPDKVICIVDAGNVRGDFKSAKSLVSDRFALLNEKIGPTQFGKMVKVCMAGSFPLFLEGISSPIRILERDLYTHVREAGWDVRYGDYSSIQHRDLQTMATSWKPHVDVAHPDVWYFERGEKSKAAKDYPLLAQRHVSKPNVWNERVGCWGTQTIELASSGGATDIYGLEMKDPGRWMSVRISQHFAQQVRRPD